MTRPRTSLHGIAASAGFGLVELMIGVVIGTFLLLGLSQVFSTSRAAYQASTGMARVQENSRFAMDFLQRDLRMAGHMGCTNDVGLLDPTQLPNPAQPDFNSHFISDADRKAVPENWANAPFPEQFHISIEGFEAVGTAPAGAVALSGANPVVVGAAADWVPALPADLLAAGVVKGSDVVMLRLFDHTAIPVIGTVNVTAVPARITVATTDASQIKAGQLYGIADCQHATVFQAGSSGNPATGVFQIAVAGLNLSDFGINHDNYRSSKDNIIQVFALRSVAYYIGQGTGGGPSLFRRTYTNGGAGVSEELVSGIENLQFLYGRDTNGASPDGQVNVYQTARNINALGGDRAANWRRVDAVRVGYLSRSVDRSSVNAAVNAPQVLGVTLTPPAGDGRVRQTYVSTITLRNRLNGG